MVVYFLLFYYLINMYKNNNAKNVYLYLKKKSFYKRKKKFIYNSKLKIVGTFGRKFLTLNAKYINIYIYLFSSYHLFS